jgi:hypothetical protein
VVHWLGIRCFPFEGLGHRIDRASCIFVSFFSMIIKQPQDPYVNSYYSYHSIIGMRDTTASASSASASEQGFSAESYFATQHPPANLDVLVASVRTFVDRQIDAGRNVVLVTVRFFCEVTHITASRNNAMTEWRNYCTAGAQRVSSCCLRGCARPSLRCVSLSVRFLDNFSAGVLLIVHPS